MVARGHEPEIRAGCLSLLRMRFDAGVQRRCYGDRSVLSLLLYRRPVRFLLVASCFAALAAVVVLYVYYLH